MAHADDAREAMPPAADPQSLTAPTGLMVRPKGEPRPMPTNFTISVATKGGTDRWLMNPGTQRLQSMRGFEDQYTDIVDYIIRITHRIWEEKYIGYIYDTYRHNAVTMDDAGIQYGRDKVVADTIQTINAFPDLRIYPDEVIWAGNDEVGFFTSHRCTFVGHNTGYSKYGPPTGRKVQFWVIANCIALENEIFEEWTIYNHSAMLQQLGFDLPTLARELGARAEVNGLDAPRFGEAERLLGQGKPRRRLPRTGEGFDVEDFIRRTSHDIWNWRLYGVADQAYAPTLRFHGPTNRDLYGLGEYKSFLLSIAAMFPDLAYQIDDLYWMGNDRDGYLTATRWSVIGTHRGHGIYGPPTGRRVHLWGITQDHIRDGKIVEEWMLFNEFHVMQQIYRD